jgi:hypothetical protein
MYLHMYISWRPLFSTMMFIPNINPSVVPSKFEVKDTTDTQRPASYIDLHISIDNR